MMAPIEAVIQQIEAAFADAPRPPNDALLCETCYDDMDIEALYEIRHWRDVPDRVIEGEWAALYSLGEAGYRHFLPAYLRFSLRHYNSGFASVQATILSLTPSFSHKTFAGFGASQRAAVIVFLETMDALGYDDIGDVGEALATWREADEK